MSRTDKSWLLSVPLTLVAAAMSGAGCSHGGPLDPLDNVGGGTMMPPTPNPTTDLPDCSMTVGAPCKIALSDLSFTEDVACGHKTDTTLGMTWNNPNGEKGRVQFGATDASTLQTCSSYERKSCDMTLGALPPLFKSIQANRIKLTFSEKHKFFSTIQTSGGNVTGAAQATGTLRFGGRDVLSIAGARTAAGGGLEQAALTAWLTPGADRSIGLRIATECGQVFSNQLSIYWSVEGMIAEMLP